MRDEHELVELPVPRYLDAASRPFPEIKPLRELTSAQMIGMLPGIVVGVLVITRVDFVVGAIVTGVLAYYGTRLYTDDPRPPVRVLLDYLRRQRAR